MNALRQYAGLIFRSRILLTGNGRTMVKLPVWAAVLLALSSLKLAILAVLAVIATGMQVNFEKGGEL
ncbi:MAG: hypothetical protein J6B53_10910 [Clostridia bacterium]|jgi:hypothetical protein|nr:hypothetical protein [Clostridia bacterium]